MFAPLVYAIMQALKKAGLPRDAVTAIVTLLVGPALTILWTASIMSDVSWRYLVQPGLTGLIASLAAMGAYKLAQWSPPPE